jgi:threonine dehydrogenase-like Zn-dependent dehydrogenase
MKAALRMGPGVVECVRVDKPQPGTGEVLIRVEAVGICGSDANRVAADDERWDRIVLGHEFAGVVETVGPDVPEAMRGLRVTVAPLIPDFSSPESQQGHFSLSGDYGFIGSRQNGAMAEYVSVPAGNLVSLPSAMSAEHGALVEPITVCLHPLLELRTLLGGSALVTGAGPIGLLALQVLKAMGARTVVVSDVVEDKLVLAKELGADLVVNPRRDSLAAAASDLPGAGVDVVFESSGNNAAKKDAVSCVRGRGVVLLVGTTPQEITFAPELFERITRKELSIVGSWMNYSAPFPGREWTTALWMLEEGLIAADRIITHRFPLERVGDAYEMILNAEEPFVKVMLTNN